MDSVVALFTLTHCRRLSVSSPSPSFTPVAEITHTVCPAGKSPGKARQRHPSEDVENGVDLPHIDFTRTTTRFRGWNQVVEAIRMVGCQVAGIKHTRVALSVLCIFTFIRSLRQYTTQSALSNVLLSWYRTAIQHWAISALVSQSSPVSPKSWVVQQVWQFLPATGYEYRFGTQAD